MPKIVSVQYLCSLCPKNKQQPIDEADVYTLRFLQGGRTFETAFCQTHGQQVVEGAEPVTGFASEASTRSRATSKSAGRKGNIVALREWAGPKGITLGKNRQKNEVIEQFEKETGQSYWLD